jgi:hypothetical protein
MQTPSLAATHGAHQEQLWPVYVSVAGKQSITLHDSPPRNGQIVPQVTCGFRRKWPAQQERGLAAAVCDGDGHSGLRLEERHMHTYQSVLGLGIY